MDRIRSVTQSPDRSDPSKAWIKVKDPKARPFDYQKISTTEVHITRAIN
jgi:hypothetical protein